MHLVTNYKTNNCLHFFLCLISFKFFDLGRSSLSFLLLQSQLSQRYATVPPGIWDDPALSTSLSSPSIPISFLAEVQYQVCLDLSDKILMIGFFLQRFPRRAEARKIIFLVDLDLIKPICRFYDVSNQCIGTSLCFLGLDTRSNSFWHLCVSLARHCSIVAAVSWCVRRMKKKVGNDERFPSKVPPDEIEGCACCFWKGTTRIALT